MALLKVCPKIVHISKSVSSKCQAIHSMALGTALENSYLVAAIQQPFCLFSDCYLPPNYPAFSQLEVFYQMSFAAVVGFLA